MGAVVFWSVVAVTLVAVVISVAVSVVGSRLRRTAISALAATLGCTYLDTAHDFIATGPGGLPTFNEGFRRQSRNLLRPTGSDIALFDYRYVTRAGRSNQGHAMTIYAVPAPADRPYPQFRLGPIDGFGWIEMKLGRIQGIAFDATPAFSTQYVLHGSDEAAVRQRFDDAALNFLVQRPDWHAEADSGWLVLWRGAKLVPPERLELYLADCRRASQYLA